MADIDFTDITACLGNNDAPLFLGSPADTTTALWKTKGFIEMGTRANSDNTPATSNGVAWTPSNTALTTGSTFWSGLFPWFTIFSGTSHTATNSRVEIYDINVLIYSKSQSAWIDLTATDTKNPTSANRMNYNLLSIHTDGIANSRVEATSGNTSYKLDTTARRPIRGYINPKSFDAADTSAIFVALKTKLIVENTGLADDRASAQYLVSTGCDFGPTINSVRTDFTPETAFPQAFSSKFHLITSTEKVIYSCPINPPGIETANGSDYFLTHGKRAHVDLRWLKRNFPTQYFPRTVINESQFFTKLKSSLILDRGTGDPAFTRNSVATVFDDRGKLITVPVNCARFSGARFVQNLLPKSVLFSDASWIKSNVGLTAAILDPIGTTTATRLTSSANAATVGISQNIPTSQATGTNRQASIYIKRGNWDWVKLTISDTTNGKSRVIWVNTATMTLGQNTITNTGTWVSTATAGFRILRYLATDWYRISCGAKNIPIGECKFTFELVDGDGVTTGNTTFTGIAGVPAFVDIWAAQFENCSIVQNVPAEYINSGVKPIPYHGAGTDGCKFSPNSLSGAAILDSELLGYQFNATSITNFALWSRDLTQAAWVKTGITPISANSGIDDSGLALATQLTATATNGTVLQTLSAGAGARSFSIYIKRVTGTGTVSITRNGSTWTDITSLIDSLSFTRVSIDNTTVATPIVGIRLGTISDSIIVDFAQDENHAFPTNPIYTAGTTSTRAAESLTYPAAGNISDVKGGILATVKRDVWNKDTGMLIGNSTSGLGLQFNYGQPIATDGLRTAFHNKKKFKPGLWLAIPQYNYRSDSAMNAIYADLIANPNIMGLSFEMFWGDFQTSINGPINLSRLYTIIERLAKPDMGKRRYVKLVFADRSFATMQDNVIVPADVFNSAPLSGPDGPDNKLHYYGYVSLNKTNLNGGVTTKGGFNLKLWQPETRTAWLAFCQKVIETFDDHPSVISFGTSESAKGAEGPVPGYPNGYATIGTTLNAEMSGTLVHWQNIRGLVSKTMCSPQINFPGGTNSFLENYMQDNLFQDGFDFDAPNILDPVLRNDGTTGNRGNLDYLKKDHLNIGGVFDQGNIHTILHSEGDEQVGGTFTAFEPYDYETSATDLYNLVRTFPANIYQITRLDATSNSEVQEIIVNGSGGTFTLSWNGHTTAAIPWNSSPATVEAALSAAGVVTGATGVIVSEEHRNYKLTWRNGLGNVIQPSASAGGLTQSGMAGDTIKKAKVTTMTSGVLNTTSEVHRIVTNASGGTWTISYNGQTTATIPYNATASQVQTALDSLSNIVPGDVVVTQPERIYLLKWSNTLNNVPLSVVNGAGLTGTTESSYVLLSHTGGIQWSHNFKGWCATHPDIVNDLSGCAGMNKNIPINSFKEAISNNSAVKMMVSWNDGEMQITSADATAIKEVAPDAFFDGFNLTNIGIGVQSSGYIKDVHIFQTTLSDPEKLALTGSVVIPITSTMSRFLSLIL